MNKKQLLIYTLITLVFFGMLYKLEYAPDTYAVFNFSLEEIYSQFASSGRFITAIVGKIIKSIQLSNKTIYLNSYILAIICTILSQYKLFKIIEMDTEKKINKFLKTIIPTLIIINPFIIELFLYIEKGIMIFGILMCIYALENLIKYLKTKNSSLQNHKYIIHALIFMFLANCSYQGIVGIFVAISTIYIIKYSKTISEFIKNNIITAGIYGIPALLNLTITKLQYPRGRINGEIIFTESAQKIYQNTIDMAKFTYGLLPKYMLILAVFFTFLLFCSKIVKDDRKVLHVLKYLYITVAITLASTLPQFIQPTQNIWFVARATYSFGAIYGILLMYVATNFEIKRSNILQIVIVTAILVVFQISTFWKIQEDRYLLNKKDEDIAIKIVEQILQYEEQTNNIISKIEIYEDESPMYSYSGIFVMGDMNIKAFSTDWSTKEIIQYYLNRKLEQSHIEAETNQEFKQKNWNEFNIVEQVRLEKDTLILCKY